MMLFKLRCATGHEFEAWFRDNAAYDRQHARGQIVCPECGDDAVEKAVMAPRLAHPRKEKAPPSPAELRRALQELRKQVETHCDYVGPRFADEARRIHNGEAAARGIYGEATPTESKALTEDGIEVASIPWVPLTDA
ncbi:MAG TPA: DUF1178 family protein [Stellaceae bacterium]|nr:DUF1178 family protein [Stellaceae bacterium]